MIQRSKRVAWLFLCLLFGMLVLSCGGQLQTVKGNIYKLGRTDFTKFSYAILPFKSASEGKTGTIRVSTDGNAIADLLTIQLLYNGYDVMERDKINYILEEQKLTQTFSQDESELAKIGKILGVDCIITGSVIQYEYDYKRGQWMMAMGVTARILNVETGKVLLVCSSAYHGDNIAETLNGIGMAITDALTEERVYVWQ